MRHTGSASNKSRVWLEQALIYSPALLALALMLPRLASAQFGLLDDGNTLSVARQIEAGDWSAIWEGTSGRSRPMYWLFYYFIYSLAGGDAFWFFFANALVLSFLTAGLILLVRLLGGSRLLASLTGVLFVLSGPVVEGFYTLSKPEPMQFAYLLVSLLAAALAWRSKNLAVTAPALLLSFVALLVANLTKEASLAMVPIGLGWFLLGGWLRRRNGDRTVVAVAAGYLLADVAAALVFVRLRAQYAVLGLPAGNYAGMYVFTLSRLIESVVRWMGWLIRDFTYIIPVVAVWIARCIQAREVRRAGLLAGALVWTVGWIAVYLPWRLAEEYYLLAFSAGIALMTAVMLEQGLRAFAKGSAVLRAIAAACLVLAAGLFLVMQVNNATNARLQLAVDATNAEMVAFLGEELPPDSIVIVNYREPTEYIDEIGLHLRWLLDRPDVAVRYLRSAEGPLAAEAERAVYLVTQSVGSVPALHIRGLTEEGEAFEAWNQEVLASLGGRARQVFESERHFRMLSVDLPRLLCFLMPQKAYCTWQRPFVDTREFSYAWSAYAVEADTE